MPQSLISRPWPATIQRMPSLARSPPAYMEAWSSARFLTQTINHLTLHRAYRQNPLKHKQIYREKTSCHTPDIINTQYYSHKKEGWYWPWWRPAMGWWRKRRMNDDLNDLISLSSFILLWYIYMYSSAILLYFVSIKIKLPDSNEIFIVSYHQHFFSLDSGLNVYRQ